jgi:hypothetical protein
MSMRLQELLGCNQPAAYFGFVNGQHRRQWLMNKPPRQRSVTR